MTPEQEYRRKHIMYPLDDYHDRECRDTFNPWPIIAMLSIGVCNAIALAVLLL